MEQINQQIQELLKKISIQYNTQAPPIFAIELFDKIEEASETIKLFLYAPSEDRKVQIQIETQLRKHLSELKLPKPVKIRFEKIKTELLPNQTQDSKLANIKNIIAIGSGKGGVGKSTVSANLAASLAKKSYKVGLLDADIYGPSLAKMFHPTSSIELRSVGPSKILPYEYKHKDVTIKVISFGFLLEKNQAVVWRGPMLGKALEQFLFQVEWGELDYLLIDLPPGTGDVQLSLAQYIALDGGIIVTTPQNIALQDAERAAQMFLQLKVPILGVIENMSSFICPKCEHESFIFSKNGAENFAAQLSVPFLGSIPLDIAVMEAGETSKPYVLSHPKSSIAESYNGILEGVNKEVEKYKIAT